MITAIDTNILLDILGNDTEFSDISIEFIESQNHLGSLVISPIVYAELLVFFLKMQGLKLAILKLEEFLKDLNIEILDFSKEDFILSAQAWQGFSNLNKIICPKCGNVNKYSCKKCGTNILWRNHLITDFLIGAHAQNHSDVFLTRDRGYYKRYFKIRIMP